MHIFRLHSRPRASETLGWESWWFWCSKICTQIWPQIKIRRENLNWPPSHPTCRYSDAFNLGWHLYIAFGKHHQMILMHSPCAEASLYSKSLSALIPVLIHPTISSTHWEASRSLSPNQQDPMSSCCCLWDSSRNYPEDTIRKTCLLLPLPKFPQNGQAQSGCSSAWDSWRSGSCYIWSCYISPKQNAAGASPFPVTDTVVHGYGFPVTRPEYNQESLKWVGLFLAFSLVLVWRLRTE